MLETKHAGMHKGKKPKSHMVSSWVPNINRSLHAACTVPQRTRLSFKKVR